jgi:ABC-type cobalamin/Fe3+-siderophores transport system ATPase subunit
MIVVGPPGSGKSYLLKRLLSQRRMTIYVDFRREPIVTGEEFMGSFVENSGYSIPTPNELTKILFREEQRKNSSCKMGMLVCSRYG